MSVQRRDRDLYARVREHGSISAVLLVGAVALVAACGSDGAGGGSREGGGAANGGGAASGAAANGGGATNGSPFGNPSQMGGGGLGGLDIDGGDDAPDDRAVCESAELVPEVEMVKLPGNILIIFDRSGSMKDTWPGGATKWADAIAAVPTAFTPIQNDLAQVGAIFFPNPAPCTVDPITAASQINFMPGPAFLMAWATYVAAASADGATPLYPALQQADIALQNPVLTNTTVVVIITDGAPNCAGGVSAAAEQLATLTPLPTTWLSKGIKTYAVGLPGSDGAIALLNGVAAAGGTTQYIPANDSATLQAELAKIVQESVKSNISCQIEIDPPPANPNDVHVIVVENGKKQDVPRDLGASGGWTINADGTTIVLQGQFCKEAMAGTYEKISVEFGCVSLPPLPPPTPT